MQHFSPAQDLTEPLGDGLMAYHKYSVPEEVRLFCMGAMLAGYRVVTGRQTLAVLAPDGTPIGSWDSLKKHWSLRWQLGLGQEPMIRHYGFYAVHHPGTRHRWWQRDGDLATAAFRAVCEELTGVIIAAMDFREEPRRFFTPE